MDLIEAIRESDRELREPICPESRRRMGDDGPARCHLTNLKTCIREINPPHPCDYYEDFLKEIEGEES